MLICGWSQVKKLRYISGDDLHRGGADAHFSLRALSLVSLAEAKTPAIFLEVHLSRPESNKTGLISPIRSGQTLQTSCSVYTHLRAKIT
jgi:hypothetical protein